MNVTIEGSADYEGWTCEVSEGSQDSLTLLCEESMLLVSRAEELAVINNRPEPLK